MLGNNISQNHSITASLLHRINRAKRSRHLFSKRPSARHSYLEAPPRVTTFSKSCHRSHSRLLWKSGRQITTGAVQRSSPGTAEGCTVFTKSERPARSSLSPAHAPSLRLPDRDGAARHPDPTCDPSAAHPGLVRTRSNRPTARAQSRNAGKSCKPPSTLPRALIPIAIAS